MQRTQHPARQEFLYLLVFFALFAAPLLFIHLSVLRLPYFWDEHGQFIPTALDLLRDGSWVAHSTLPNVHPPGVEAYLVLWYKLFGYSILTTRVAMLMMAAAGVLITFLLSIELSRGSKGAPAFLPPLLLIATPLFYTQSMMAQLDMPAMVMTLLTLLLFTRQRYIAAALAAIVLVMFKETGIVIPAVCFVWLVFKRDWRNASCFVAPAIALGAWLVVLHHATGFWLGNPDFAHYNVGYSLHPVRMMLSIVRRIYYIFLAEFRFVGTALIVFVCRKTRPFKSGSWQIVLLATGATVVLVSVLGGAELERYLMPVLPIFLIAVAVASTYVPKWAGLTVIGGLFAGLVGSMFWNPPYPFPFENNLAMVDFVRLQQAAAQFAEHGLKTRTIATAWPYTAALRRPEFGFVDHGIRVIETNDFHADSIRKLAPSQFDSLIVYTRVWAPENGVMAIPLVRSFLTSFYEYQPEITESQVHDLGLNPAVSWESRGQRITVYIRGYDGSRPDNPHPREIATR